MIENDFPSVEEIEMEYSDPALEKLGKEIMADVSFAGKTLKEAAIKLPEVSAKYATMLADFDYQESVADARMKIIRSRIILAFEDDPKAFLRNTKRRNIQICEAVYRTHPQFRDAMNKLLLIAAKRKMVQQATYAIDQARTMLRVLEDELGPEGDKDNRPLNQSHTNYL